MILKRYCIDCGCINPPENAKCCPDSRVFWVEREAAEKINAAHRAAQKTFEGLVSENHQLKARVKELEDGIRAHKDESTSGATANMRLADDRLHRLIAEYRGLRIRVVADPTLPPDTIEFRGQDGTRQRVTITGIGASEVQP